MPAACRGARAARSTLALVSGTCAECGAEHGLDARFCAVCGAPLARVCPACGAENHAAAAFCSTCGFALVDGARRVEALVAGTDERRVVTVLFADLAGSTALGERLDPEDVRAVQADLFALVGAEVERFGGVTEKFVGDAVLAVFGVPQAHEDDAERAVRAALAIVEAFGSWAARVRERYSADLGLRVGVNTGEVVAGREAAARGEVMVTGDAVNVAARLEQLARPGTVLVGSRTYQATHRVIRYRRVDALEAKGKSAPVDAWEALAVVGRPGARVSHVEAPLIGRTDELALLRLAAARVERERTPQLVTVYGHAGVGKSRLVSEFVARLEHARVLVGSCVPYGDGVTYLPLIEVASALAGIRDDDANDVALGKVRAAVEDVVAEEHVARVLDGVSWTIGLSRPEPATGLGGGVDVRSRLRQAWALYLAALGQQGLVVLLLEDIHWASESFLDLVEGVFGLLESSAVLIVCVARPELVDARPQWGGGRVTASSLMLAPLARSESESLLQALLAGAVSDRVARSILEPAEGNPFFVEEMLAMLVERGALEQRDGEWVETARLERVTLPDSIHGIIAARIDMLEARERDALRRCSVMGRTFWPSAVGVDDDVVGGLTGRALVSEQASSSFSGRREFSFKHALTRDVAYGTLPRSERGALHRAVAEWLRGSVPERHAETTELVAYHYDQALLYGEADDELRRRAFEALLEAGDAVLRRGSYEQARRLFARALELAPDDVAERERALLLAARVDALSADYEIAIARLDEVIAEAGRRGDDARRADALGWKARALWLAGDWRPALEAAREATAVLQGHTDSAELARALARLSQIEMLRGLPSAADTASRAIEVARSAGEKTAEANARTNLFTVRSSAGEVPTTAEMQAIIDLALESGAPDEAVRAVVNFLWSAALLGPPEEAETIVIDALSRLEPGLAAENFARYLDLSLAALVFVPMGRWSEADDVTAVEEPASAPTNRLVWLWVVCGLALRRGDLALVDRHLPELRESALASEEPQRIVPMASVAMPRALLAGDHESLRTLGETVIALPWQAIMHSPGTTSISRALAAAGEGELVHRLALRLAELEGPDHVEVVASTARGLDAALQGSLAEAASLLRRSEEHATAQGRRYEAACLALEVARVLELDDDGRGAAEARARADDVLVPLACVNPY